MDFLRDGRQRSEVGPRARPAYEHRIGVALMWLSGHVAEFLSHLFMGWYPGVFWSFHFARVPCAFMAAFDVLLPLFPLVGYGW